MQTAITCMYRYIGHKIAGDTWLLSYLRDTRDASNFSCSVHEFHGSISIRNRPWTVVIEQDGENKVSTRRCGVATRRRVRVIDLVRRGRKMNGRSPAMIERDQTTCSKYNRMILVRWSILYARTSPVGLSITRAFDPSFLPFFLTFRHTPSSRHFWFATFFRVSCSCLLAL